MLAVPLRKTNRPRLVETRSAYEDGAGVTTLDRPRCLLCEPALRVGRRVVDFDHTGTGGADAHQVHGAGAVERTTAHPKGGTRRRARRRRGDLREVERPMQAPPVEGRGP